jgi:hypothetical protein
MFNPEAAAAEEAFAALPREVPAVALVTPLVSVVGGANDPSQTDDAPTGMVVIAAVEPFKLERAAQRARETDGGANTPPNAPLGTVDVVGAAAEFVADVARRPRCGGCIPC